MLVTELLAPGRRLTDKQGASWVLYGEPTHGLRPPIKLRSVEPLLNGPRREVVYEIYAYIAVWLCRVIPSGGPKSNMCRNLLKSESFQTKGFLLNREFKVYTRSTFFRPHSVGRAVRILVRGLIREPL